MIAVPLLANVLYRPQLSSQVEAYIGVGAGGVATTFAYSSGFLSTYEDDVTFGYQAMAGIDWQLDEHWGVGLAYKFLGTTDHNLGGGVKSDGTMTHSFLLSASYRF